jgi:hypothetical protein
MLLDDTLRQQLAKKLRGIYSPHSLRHRRRIPR